MKQAVRDMVEFLVEETRLPPYDAYTLLSLAGDIRVSRTFRAVAVPGCSGCFGDHQLLVQSYMFVPRTDRHIEQRLPRRARR